jgi:hypothetical protein
VQYLLYCCALLMLAALICLQEPLLTLLLQHKWEKFARTQVSRLLTSE